MSLKIGIVGMPNAGKSTLFKALTKIEVEIANYPFTTIKPNVGILPVPDERFEKIVELIKPASYFPAIIEIYDIAGLIKGAHKGEGLGNEFLSYIYEVDAILFLLNCFGVDGDPKEALEILKEELNNKDKTLAEKPNFVACNIRSGKENAGKDICELTIDAKLELEMNDMSKEDIAELELKSQLPLLIQRAYKTLSLITFYTIKGGKETRAWAIPSGTIAPEAGGVVHTDFKEKFIKAEVIEANKLVESDGWKKARELGWVKTEGKEYIVKDGDVVEFKI
ncbi:DUF933 domain-containing protein [Patescibacteria group bacterium]